MYKYIKKAELGDKLKDTKFGSFMDSKLGNGLTQASSSLGSLQQNGGAEAAAIKSGIRSVTDKLGPIGMAIGAADDLLGGISSMAGKTLAGLSTGDKIISSIPVLGNALSFFSGSLTKHNFDLSSVANDFSTTKENEASNLGGQNMLFGKGKKESQIADAWNNYNKKVSVSEYNKKRQSNDISNTLVDKNMQQYINGGDQVYNIEKGMKFPELEAARLLYNKFKTFSNTKKYQLGGKMNLIPSGARHCRKNNLEEVNPELKDQITNKGIPVISKCDGEVVQHAEIECDELILRKEFTDKLEELYRQYQDKESDDLAIEAGKLVCYELLKNTEDQTGLIKSVK